MKFIHKTFFVIASLVLASCATIVSGSRQKILISSEPSAATVLINDVEVGKTPITQNLKRNQNYQLVLKIDGYKPYETALSKEFNAWYIGNIVFGGIIGLIVDPITGAMFKLSPKEINANLSGTTAAVGPRKEGVIYLDVRMDIDPTWEKVGQLTKVDP